MTLLLALFKFAVAVFAVLMIVAGLIIMPTPLPFGVVLVAIGLMLLVAVAPSMIRDMRRRFRWFDRFMHWIEKGLPEWLARRLRETDIEHPETRVLKRLF